MKKILNAGLLTILLSFGQIQPVKAAVYLISFSGTVSDSNSSPADTPFFGLRNGESLNGKNFVFTYSYNDSIPVDSYVANSQVGVVADNDLGTPFSGAIDASISINGVTYRPASFDTISTDPDPVSRNQLVIDNHPTGDALNLSGLSYGSTINTFAEYTTRLLRYGIGFSPRDASLFNSTSLRSLVGFDYMCQSGCSGSFLIEEKQQLYIPLYDNRNRVYAFETRVSNSSISAALNANRVTISSVGAPAIPEPTAWVLMLAGFGLTGGALRRHEARKSPNVAKCDQALPT